AQHRMQKPRRDDPPNDCRDNWKDDEEREEKAHWMSHLKTRYARIRGFVAIQATNNGLRREEYGFALEHLDCEKQRDARIYAGAAENQSDIFPVIRAGD